MSVLFPNVPIAPGVPPVLRKGLGIANAVSLLAADAALFTAQPAKWKILNSSGASLFPPDVSIDAVGGKQDFAIAGFPIEQGGWRNYDKVQIPGEVRVKIVKMGNVTERQQFRTQVEKMAGTLDLLKLQTPERIMGPFSVEHFDWERTSSNGGMTMIEVETWFKYLGIVGGAPFQNTAQAGGAAPLAGGQSSGRLPFGSTALALLLGAQLGVYGQMAAGIAVQLGAFSGSSSALGSISGIISGLSSQVISAGTSLVNSATSFVSSAFSGATGFLNAGFLTNSLLSPLSTATSLVTSVLPIASQASLLPQLAAATAGVGQLSENLITGAQNLAAGGSALGTSFSLPPTIPAASSLGQALSANPNAFSANGYTFGPVYSSAVK